MYFVVLSQYKLLPMKVISPNANRQSYYKVIVIIIKPFENCLGRQ